MALTKVTGSGIEDGTLSVDDIADDAITADKLANSINTDIATGVAGNTTANIAITNAATAQATANIALPKAGGTMTGTIAGFTSTGIDDNATSTAITIGGDESVNLGPVGTSSDSIKTYSYGNYKKAIILGRDAPAVSRLELAYDSNGTENAYLSRFYGSSKLHFDMNGVDHMVIDSAGRVTMPNQPAFSAILAVNWDVEGDMTFATTNLSDPAWNGTRFTVPVAGKYVFSWGGIGLNAAVGGGGTARMNIKVNGVGGFGAEARADSSYDYDPASSTLILYLQASDYVTIENTDTRGWYPVYGHFSGHLIG